MTLAYEIKKNENGCNRTEHLRAAALPPSTSRRRRRQHEIGKWLVRRLLSYRARLASSGRRCPISPRSCTRSLSLASLVMDWARRVNVNVKVMPPCSTPAPPSPTSGGERTRRRREGGSEGRRRRGGCGHSFSGRNYKAPGKWQLASLETERERERRRRERGIFLF